ncbi:MAG: IclR family transcriptional regulator [Gammaproteobacteria bacterium]|nr:MAG: IclR family transcriptional regulator [Gammaproteobacteria bacterium]
MKSRMSGTDKTLSKGLSLIEALAQNEAPFSVSGLSRACGLTKSNTHRLLQTLKLLGYVRQVNKGGDYELTLKLWELGTMVHSRIDLTEVASEHMRRLAEKTKETVHLSMLDDGHVVYVDKIDSPHPIRAYSRKGGQAPAYCVATGKVLLAYQPIEVQRRVCTNCFSFTPTTVTELDELLLVFSKVRRNGYAFNFGEWREGVFGVAAPIRNSEGSVIAAVGITGPADRLPRARLKKLVPTVVASARAIAVELGYREKDI